MNATQSHQRKFREHPLWNWSLPTYPIQGRIGVRLT